MADETTVAVAASPEKAAAPKRSKLLPLLLIAITLLLIGGGGAGWFLLRRGAKPATAAAAEPAAPKYTVHLDGFTVNLDDPESNDFLRITIDLGLGHAPPGGGDNKSGSGDFPTSRVRDAILPVLTAAKADVLLTPEGKAKLKEDLIQALRENVPEIDVREVYFTEFLVQK